MAEDNKIFTQEMHEQLLEAAVAKGISEATSDKDTEVLRLNEQVEALQKVVTDKDKEIAELAKSIEERDEEARLAELATERLGKVKEKANFTDEQLEARKEGWAKMEEDAFNTYLEDIEAVAKASTKDGDPPKTTIFEGARDTASEGTDMSALKTVFAGIGAD